MRAIFRPFKITYLALTFALLTPCTPGFGDDTQPEMGPYEVRLERSYFVTMRDGVRLSTDLYLPVDAGSSLGTILERTPYNKGSERFRGEGFSIARFFASHGFVYAVQDKRGKFESEGEYLTTDGDIEDADDALDWIAAQPWSNGKVGMMGCSYPGFTTIMGAQSLNSHLKAIIPQSAAMATGSLGNRYSYLWRQGGMVALSMALWHAGAGSKVFYRPPPGLTREQFLEVVDMFDPVPQNMNMKKLADPAIQKEFRKAYLTLPFIDILQGFDVPPNDWELMTSFDITDPWWDERGYLTEHSKVDVPALHINGWHDYGVAQTFIQFNYFREHALSELARENQYVIVSPTSHCVSETVSEKTVVGDLDVGDARFDYWGTYLRWYDRWLNGNKTALDGMPHVQYYNVGTNEWRSAETWPLPETEYRKFFLTSGGEANSRFGNGRLDSSPHPDSAASDTYVYDPATPYTTISALTDTDAHVMYGAFNRSELENRNDVLIYTSDVLEKAVEVTGPMKAVLYVSSSAKDTDFIVTLVDVFPDGRAIGVYEGQLRARYREGYEKRVFMEPGQVYELEVDMNATSNTFLPGHRIRVEITSSSFPTYERNLNTGGDNFNEREFVVAENVIHHSETYPSRIVLPIIPK